MKKEKNELKCPKCDTVSEFDEEDLRGFFNWKCPHCNKINPLISFGVIWKCPTGTPPRRKNG